MPITYISPKTLQTITILCLIIILFNVAEAAGHPCVVCMVFKINKQLYLSAFKNKLKGNPNVR